MRGETKIIPKFCGNTQKSKVLNISSYLHFLSLFQNQIKSMWRDEKMGKNVEDNKSKSVKLFAHAIQKFYIYTIQPYKRSNEASDAKNNYYCRSGDMHHLRCVDLLWFHEIHAKGCDTFTGFDFKRLSELVCEGGGNRDW